MNRPDQTIYGGGEREAGEDGLIQPTADEARNGRMQSRPRCVIRVARRLLQAARSPGSLVTAT